MWANPEELRSLQGAKSGGVESGGRVAWRRPLRGIFGDIFCLGRRGKKIRNRFSTRFWRRAAAREGIMIMTSDLPLLDFHPAQLQTVLLPLSLLHFLGPLPAKSPSQPWGPRLLQCTPDVCGASVGRCLPSAAVVVSPCGEMESFPGCALRLPSDHSSRSLSASACVGQPMVCVMLARNSRTSRCSRSSRRKPPP